MTNKDTTQRYNNPKYNNAMKTDLEKVRNYYIDVFRGDLFKGIETSVLLNDRRVQNGAASITLEMSYPNDNFISLTIYIIEKHSEHIDITSILFVNNGPKSVIWSNINRDPLAKSYEYIRTYLERTAMRFKGMEIGELEKKPRHNNYKNNYHNSNDKTNDTNTSENTDTTNNVSVNNETSNEVKE